MFSSGPNYSKLKTNLRLAVNRLRLLEKKKTELAQKSRKEIADFLSTGKTERAKIRVEHIIREDYLVEAMEVVEMYCDLLLARYGLLQQMKELDENIAEPVASLIWVAPRLQAEVEELRVVADILTTKYGKEYAEHARTTTGDHKVSEKLMHKLSIQAPPKLLVEKYLIEIAKIYNIAYEPDPQVMREEGRPIGLDGMLIDLQPGSNNLGGGGGGGGGHSQPPMGFIDFPQPPALPVLPQPTGAFNYPQPGTSSTHSAPPFSYNIPPYPQLDQEKKDLNTQFLSGENQNFPPPYSAINPNEEIQNLNNTPKPQPRSKMSPPPPSASAPPRANDELPNLPNVPLDLPDVPNSTEGNNNDEDIDFDDLSRRFEELKKKK
ncbi:IST1 homolog isoform X2 [Sitodiplosis mosellana]|uniref:IST1 homolog isoform X2 n=1 Tax=Sitodiplosis mosellana TaxID=263140 RepID=UPI00244472D8|nr:IST1 homolog isoform X2 [Sitodiplosis mosellana]